MEPFPNQIKTKILSFFGQFFVNRLLNLAKHEWGRVVSAWFLRFFTQIATVLGFTLLTVFFIEKNGIPRLPMLFILQSLFAITGTLLFSEILKKVSKNILFLTSSLLGAIFLIIAFFLQENVNTFWLLLLATFSIFLGQMNILLLLFIEELFSPLESERTFPIVESAEPLGTLFSGLIAVIGISLFGFHVSQLLVLWAGIMGAIVPIFLLLERKLRPVPIPKSKAHIREKNSKKEEFEEMIEYVKNIPFLKGLLVVIFLHWFGSNFIEFQFTKAINLEFVQNAKHLGESYQEVDALAEGFGSYQIIISVLFLLSEIILASRVLKHLGLMRSILLHPLTSFFAAVSMFFRYNFFTAVGAKATYEIIGGLKKNAYNASFYALRPKVRELAKEFLEGIARPMGMMAGTVVLLLIQKIFPQEWGDHLIAGTLMIVFLIMFFEAYKLRKKYTFLAKKSLETQGNIPEKFDAIEILAQNGHDSATSHLIKSLLYRKERPEVQIKILRTLGMLRDPMAIPEILKFLHHEKKEVQLAAVQAIGRYDNLANTPETDTFSEYRVVEALKSLIFTSTSKQLKSEVILLFKNIKKSSVVPFLLELLQSSDPKIRSDAVHVCSLFHDYSSAYYLEKCLDDPHPMVRANALIALWKFIPYRLRLLLRLNEMLRSADPEVVVNAVYAVGEISLKEEISKLKEMLEHPNADIRLHAAIAIAKLGDASSVKYIVDALLSSSKETMTKILRLVEEIDDGIKSIIMRSLTQRISEEVFSVLKKARTPILEDMEEDILKELLHAYTILKEEQYTLMITDILEKKSSQKKFERDKKAQEKEERECLQEISLEELCT
ncbi:MFS transporter [Candidatus Peregrinibacteria bacterium]|nr:MFS transporter [Candidatus Peregrinibacteria bacterium]